MSHTSLIDLPSLDPHYMSPEKNHGQSVAEKAQSTLPLGRTFGQHNPGQRTLDRVQKAYDALYQLTQLDAAYSIFYCHSFAMAQAHALFSVYMDYGRKCGRGHFIASKCACGPVVMQLERLCELGASFDLVQMHSGGGLDIEHLKSLITPRTQMISLALVDAHSGIILELEAIRQICADRGIFLHLDLSHAWYQLPDKMSHLASLGADLMTIDGYTCGASFGGALLITRPGMRLEPLLPSGPPLLSYLDVKPTLIWDLVVALEHSLKQSAATSMRLAGKKSRFEKKLIEAFEEYKLPTPLFPFSKSYRSKKNLKDLSCAPSQNLILFPSMHNEHLAFLLAEKNLSFSLGGGPSQQLHYFLRDCHFPALLHHSGISLRLDPRLSGQDIDKITQTIAQCAQIAHQSAFEMEVN